MHVCKAIVGCGFIAITCNIYFFKNKQKTLKHTKIFSHSFTFNKNRELKHGDSSEINFCEKSSVLCEKYLIVSQSPIRK